MINKDILSKEEASMLLADNFNQSDLSCEDDKVNEYISRILDVELELDVLLGKTKMRLSDVYNLGKGSLIELDTFKDQDVEVLVGDKVLAYGKIVVIDLNFGIKITKIVNEKNLINSII